MNEGRERRRWWVLPLVILLLVGVGLAVAPRIRARFWPGTFESPETAELPPIASSELSRKYLSGPGSLVRDLRRTTQPITGSNVPVSSLCHELMTQELPKLGSPTAIASAIVGIPDQPTAEIALGYFDALKRWLPSCAAGSPESRDELIFTGIVLDRRLAELGS